LRVPYNQNAFSVSEKHGTWIEYPPHKSLQLTYHRNCQDAVEIKPAHPIAQYSRVGKFLYNVFLDRTSWTNYHCSWVPYC